MKVRLQLIKTFTGITILLILSGAGALVQGQSGRVKASARKPGVAVSPVETPTPSLPAKPKKSERPQFVDGERIYLSREVDTKARVWKNTPPASTKEARRNSFHGKILLELILAANGKVTNITILKSMPYGLNQKALEAAQQIKFDPALKDGKPVSQWVQIEYEFWFM